VTQDIDVKLRQLLPVLGEKKVMNMRVAYLLEDDSREKKAIENHIDFLISRHVKPALDPTIILPPPEQSLCSGDLYLGDVEYLKKKLFPFNLKLKDLNRHIFLGGSTGSGKTTLALHIIRQLHKKDIPFIIIDWEKSYRDLAQEFDDVEVYTVGRDINPIHFNILDVPPGITKAEYTKGLVNLFGEDFLSGAGSDYILLKQLEVVFNENDKPTFADLKESFLQQMQKDMGPRGRLAGRAGLWKETVLRILSFLGLKDSSSANVLHTNKHYPIEKLFNKKIVLEFGGVKNKADRKFIIHCLLNWISLYNDHRGIASEELKQVIIFEEFHNLCLKSKEDNMVSSLFRECRKYGLGLIAIDQTPSEIPNAIFANCNVKISFALGTNQDISAMAKAMNLQFDERDFLGMLETGQAIINIKQNFTHSFGLRIPYVKSKANMTDLELQEAMRTVSRDSHVICSSNKNQGSPLHPSSSHILPPTISNQPDQPLQPMERIIIQDILNHPYDGSEKRRERLNLQPKEIKTLTDSMISKGLVMPVIIDNMKLFELLDYGRKKAEQTGLYMKKRRVRGSLEHSFIVIKVRDHLNAIGLHPEIEKDDIDVVVSEPELILAAEIETGKAQPYRSIKKLLQTQFKHKWLVATSKETEQMLTRITSSMPDIKVLYYKDLLKVTNQDLNS